MAPSAAMQNKILGIGEWYGLGLVFMPLALLCVSFPVWYFRRTGEGETVLVATIDQNILEDLGKCISCLELFSARENLKNFLLKGLFLFLRNKSKNL
jgi:hypothetical protein